MSSSFKTFLKHTAKDFHNQSVNPPVVRASTIIFKSMKDIRKTQAKAQKNPIGGHYDYARQGTSTTYILQKILTKLEESYHVFTTPTGLMGLKIKCKNINSVRKFVNSLKLFGYGYSWGGFESLALHQEYRETGTRKFLKLAKDEHLVRLHIGLEDPSDLIADIKQALKHLK